MSNESQYEGLRNAQEIATQKAQYEYGTKEQQEELVAAYTKDFRSFSSAQSYLDRINNGENVEANKQAFADALGVAYEDIKDSSADELKDILVEKTSKLLEDVFNVFGIDLSGGTSAEELQAIANDTSNKAHNLVKVMLEIFDKLGVDLEEVAAGINGSAGETTFSEAYQKGLDALSGNAADERAINFLYDNRNSLIDSNMPFDNYSGWQQEYNNVFTNHPELTAAMELARRDAAYRPMFDSMISNLQMNGNKDFDYYDAQANALFGDYYNNGQFNLNANNAGTFGKMLEDLRENNDTKAILDDWSSGMSDIVDIINDLNSSDPDKVAKAIKALNDQMNDKKAADVTKYSKKVSGLSDIISGLKKGGTDATKAQAQLDATMKKLQDQQTALSKAAGKSGKQIRNMKGQDSQTLGFLQSIFPEYTEDQIASMTKEQIQDLIDKAGPIIGEQFSEVVDALGSAIPETELDIPLSDIVHMRADGTIDLTDVEDKLSEASERILAAIMALAHDYGGIDLQAILKDKSVDIKGFFRKLSGAGVRSGKSYSGSKSSGGGGGKSELDKSLERIKHQIGEIEHEGKMLQTLFEGLDFVNDYGGMNSNIDQQIANQEKLRSAYASSIAELQGQLATLQAGTDDWYKASEAIWQYQEALAAVSNTINQLRSAKITILEQKHEYASGPKNHKGTILEKRAQRYQITGQFEAYEDITKQSIANTKEQIKENEKQITEWENLLKKTVKNSDDWYKIRDKIWAKKEENEQLLNDALQAEIELEKARIDQIAKELQLSTMNYEHMNNMFSTFAGMYESTFNFEQYRSAMQEQSSNLAKIKAENDEAIKKMKEEIADMADDDPAKEYAVQMLHQLEEQNATIQAELLQNQQAIEESYINEIQHNYDEKQKELELEADLLEAEFEKYQRAQDYTNQENIYNEKARNLTDEITLQKEQLQALEDLLNSGNITEGSQQWFDLRDLIRSVTKSIADLENQYTSTTDKLMELHLDHLINSFKEGYTDEDGNIVFEGMDQLQHERNLIGYQKTKYQNRGELKNVGIMLEAEQERIVKQRDATITQIQNLKNLKEAAKDMPAIYDKITEEIKTQEEALAKYTNELEQTTQAIEKNKEAIRQARMKVENEADKAIRSVIQKQKNMLAATVSIQNTILDNIRNYYREQWDLQKKTIDKEKQALNEEKNLLTEQLNFKRRMMDQESKEEELAEYKRQLALISADTTRSKDANELRRKISEMEKEMAIQTAQDIANAETKSIDDRIKGWDNYVSVQEEDLNNMLNNANNFRELIDQLMSGSYEDFVAWNASINKSYINATDEQRLQMEEAWDDTWLNMLGQIRTYWDEVDEASRSKDGFLSLLMSTDDYQKLSDTGKESYLYNMGEMWDNFYKAYNIEDAAFSDSHEILNTLNDLKDWTFSVRLSNAQDLFVDTRMSTYNLDTNHTGADKVKEDLYTGWGVDPPPPTPEPEPVAPTPTPPSGGGGTAPYIVSYFYIDASATIHKKHAKYSNGTTKFICNESHTWKGAMTNGTRCDKCGHLFSYYTPGSNQNKNTNTNTNKNSNTNTNTSNKNTGGGIAKGNQTNMKYAEGGLVDYTGPAWVDGTKTHPEAFLDAVDTALLRSMLDQFTYVRNMPYMTNVDTSKYGNTNVSVGDVNVNLYEAKLENDADYDLIAKKVGNAFTKQLQKDGFNLAGYNW